MSGGYAAVKHQGLANRGPGVLFHALSFRLSLRLLPLSVFFSLLSPTRGSKREAELVSPLFSSRVPSSR